MFKLNQSSYEPKSVNFKFFIEETKIEKRRKWKQNFLELAKACSYAIHR